MKCTEPDRCSWEKCAITEWLLPSTKKASLQLVIRERDSRLTVGATKEGNVKERSVDLHVR
jgi:hypothetical protein